MRANQRLKQVESRLNKYGIGISEAGFKWHSERIWLANTTDGRVVRATLTEKEKTKIEIFDVSMTLHRNHVKKDK